MWPNLHGGFGSLVTLGTITDVNAAPAVAGTTLEDGAPAYFQIARALRPAHRHLARLHPGESSDGSGIDINVRAPISAAHISAASRTSAPRTTGSSAPAMARGMTAWGPRSTSSVPPRAASTASQRSSAPMAC
jgi:hypothetical protein